MFKIISYCCLVCVVLISISCADKQKDAKAYFDEVISKTDSAVTVFNGFIDGSTYFQVDSMNVALTKIESTIKEQGALIANMEDYKGDATLRVAAITFINQLNEVSTSEFKQMVKICAVSDTLQEERKSNTIDSLAAVMGLKVNLASKPFLKSQTEFAAKNKIKLSFDYEIAPAMKQELDSRALVK